MRILLLAVLLMFGTANAEMRIDVWESADYPDQTLGAWAGSVCIDGYSFAVITNRFGMQMVQISDNYNGKRYWLKCDE